MKAREKIIDGYKVTVNPFYATEGLSLQMRLLNLLGEPLKKLIAGVEAISLDAQLDMASLGEALGGLLSKFDEETATLVKRLVANCYIDMVDETTGKQVSYSCKEHFEIVFSGRYALLYKVAWFVLEVNYADFFDLLKNGGLGIRVKSSAEAQSGSETTAEKS